MSIRTTPDAVKDLLLPGHDYDPAPEDGSEPHDLVPFIETASALVDDLIAFAVDEEVTVTAGRAELIERWLSAHYYVQSDQVEASHSEGGASASFQGQTGMGLENSKYGQTAMDLDTTGYLAGLGADGRPSFEWGGKRASEEIPYWERN